MDSGGKRARVLCCATLVLAAWAWAGQKTLVVATGDCRNAELLTGAAAFQQAMKAQLKGDLLEPDVLLDTLRPRPSRSVDDIKRQVDLARTLFYGGQYERCADVLKQALGELSRVSPLLKPWDTTAEALALDALDSRQLGKKEEFATAFKRILRLDPAARLDPDLYTPSILTAFEGLRKEVARTRKTSVSVISTPSGADVFIDGRPMGTTPTRVDLLPGSYTVALTKADAVSFVRPITVKAQAQELQVDLAFEGAVSAQLPLCVMSELNDTNTALKLGGAASADRVVVFWLASRAGDPANYSVSVFASGRQERAASIVPPRHDTVALRELAAFVTTGEAARGILPAGQGRVVPPPTASEAPKKEVVAEAAKTAPTKEEPKKPAAAPGSEGLKRPAGDPPKKEGAAPTSVSPKNQTAALGSDTPRREAAAATLAPPASTESPPSPVVAQSSTTSPRVAAWVVGGAGLVLGAAGGVLYAVGGADRTALEALKDANGKLPLPGSTGGDQAAQLMPRVDVNRAASLALVGAGVGALAAGAVLFVVLPGSEVAVSVAPGAGGAGVAVSGRF